MPPSACEHASASTSFSPDRRKISKISKQVSPEYVEGATATPHTRKRNKTALKPGSYDMTVEYTADKIAIVAYHSLVSGVTFSSINFRGQLFN